MTCPLQACSSIYLLMVVVRPILRWIARCIVWSWGALAPRQTVRTDRQPVRKSSPEGVEPIPNPINCFTEWGTVRQFKVMAEQNCSVLFWNCAGQSQSLRCIEILSLADKAFAFPKDICCGVKPGDKSGSLHEKVSAFRVSTHISPSNRFPL